MPSEIFIGIAMYIANQMENKLIATFIWQNQNAKVNRHGVHTKSKDGCYDGEEHLASYIRKSYNAKTSQKGMFSAHTNQLSISKFPVMDGYLTNIIRYISQLATG